MKHFDYIHFTNGYGKDKDSFVIECDGISIWKGKECWGAEKDKFYFVISLGDIIYKNIKTK